MGSDTKSKRSLFWRFKKILPIYGMGYYKPLIDGNAQPGFTTLYKVVSFPTFFLPIILLPFLEFVDLFLHDDFLGVARTLNYAVATIPVAFKGVIIRWNNAGFQKIVYQLEVALVKKHCNYKGDYEILKECTRKAYLFSTYYFFATFGIISSAALAAIQVNRSNGNTQGRLPMPSPMYIPYYDKSDVMYIIGYTYGIIGPFFIGNFYGTIEALMIAIMLHLKAQFVIIQRALTDIQTRTFERILLKDKEQTEARYTEESISKMTKEEIENIVKENYSESYIREEMYLSLRNCVLHHIDVIECAKDYEDNYHLGYLAHLSVGLGHLCLSLLVITGYPITNIFVINSIVMFFGVEALVFMQFWCGNELTHTALILSDTIYNTNWYNEDLKFKKLLAMMLMRAQRPVELTCGKFTKLSLATSLSMCKAAYSYFALIRHVNKS